MDGVLVNSRLTVVLEVGTNGSGEPIFRNKNFTNIKTLATDSHLRDTALALMTLQVHPIEKMDRNNVYSL
ncbi:DUF1659 domain-containing protein [Anaerobacillus sp. MEB173]|uniref:DUF1659 domain-containing protein n=1 Tax=Anaerobacillus sp. MEB173 TaxID=3383345 RepID=UPI003F8E2815